MRAGEEVAFSSSVSPFIVAGTDEDKGSEPEEATATGELSETSAGADAVPGSVETESEVETGATVAGKEDDDNEEAEDDDEGETSREAGGKGNDDEEI